MGQMALGLAGAAVGFAVGGPTGAQIGWMLGSFAWNLLDPPKVEGPRLNDTKVRGADYGSPRPIVYGMCRVGGLGMGQGSTANGPNEFTEHAEKSGGKGGPEVTNYRYTLSFFNEICEGPIAGVKRRWANGKLITEADAASNDTWPFVLYLGDATQMPDPTMETVYGVGEVNPMRGVAYESIEEKDVTDFGNARPNVEYEVFTSGGDIPWRVSSFTWTIINYNLQEVRRLPNGHIQIFAVGGAGDTYVKISEYKTDGTEVGSTYDLTYSGLHTRFTVHNLNVFAAGTGTTDVFWYTWDESLREFGRGVDITASYADGTAGITSTRCIYKNGYIYGVGGGITVGLDTFRVLVRYECTGKVPGDYDGTYGALDDAYTASAVYLGDSDDDYIYAIASDGSGNHSLFKFDGDLNLVHSWGPADLAGYNVGDVYAGNFIVYKGMVCTNHSTGSGVYEIALTQINADNTLTDAGVLLSHNSSALWNLGGGLGLDTSGVFSLNPPSASETLGSIVLDLCERAGLDASQVDVTDLTQTVRGFVVASQMTARNAIDALRKAFFFDAAEIDGKLVFRNRGHDAIATIPDGDLAAHEPGSDVPEPLEVTRIPESELPRTVFINYYDPDADYQSGSQYWRRTVTRSQSDVTLDLPVVFTATEALLRAQWHMHFACLERDRFTFYTTRKWSKLTPTDVVVVRGVNIRITGKTESPNGLIKFDGVRAFAGAFTGGDPVTIPIDGGTSGSGGSGQPPGTISEPAVATQLVLLDLPIVSQGDYPFGFYAAMGPSIAGPWPGASLYKSIDGGVTYSSVASASSAAIIGTITSGSLSSYGGGDTVDESTCTVVLVDPDATLESITGTALTNGGNLCAIRSGSTWEVCGFRDAVLVDPQTYELTGFLRGRKGTTTAGHADGDRFVALPTTNVDAPEVELNVSLKYKAVTFGTAIADAAAQDFTNTGESAGGSNGQLGGGSFDQIAAQFPITRTVITAGTYTLLSTDRSHLLQFDNAAGVTVTLPDDLPKKWWVFIENIGAGDVDLDPSGTAEIDGNGGAVLTLATDQGILLVFDGVDYGTSRGMGSGGGGGSALTIKDEGTNLDTAVESIDFVGGGVTATNTGHAVTATIPLKAPLGASYVTLGTDADLTSERVLTAGSGVTLTDAGAGSTVTVAVPAVAAQFVTLATSGDLANERVLTAGTGISINDAGAGSTVTIASLVGGGFSGCDDYTTAAAHSWVCPAGVTAVELDMIGGGGGGAGGSAAATGGGGGGSGEQTTGFPVTVVPGDTYTVTIPAAAAGGTAANGNDGGVVTFASASATLASVAGGNGGKTAGNSGAGGGPRGAASAAKGSAVAGATGTQESTCNFGGSSGAPGGGTTAQNGGVGGSSGSFTGGAGGTTASSKAGGGGGAASPYGSGGAAGNGGANGTSAAAGCYGAGGGGGGGDATSTVGGDGMVGRCRVRYVK